MKDQEKRQMGLDLGDLERFGVPERAAPSSEPVRAPEMPPDVELPSLNINTAPVNSCWLYCEHCKQIWQHSKQHVPDLPPYLPCTDCGAEVSTERAGYRVRRRPTSVVDAPEEPHYGHTKDFTPGVQTEQQIAQELEEL